MNSEIHDIEDVKNAFLKIYGLTQPVVVIGSREIKVRRLRGINSEIIHYCLTNYPDKEVSLDQLKDELKISGVDSLKKKLENTQFHPDHGDLKDFSEATTTSILIRSKISITDTFYEKLASASF